MGIDPRSPLAIAPRGVVSVRQAPRAVVGSRTVVGRVARGWGETAVDLPGDTLALASRTLKKISHPVTAARSAWSRLRTEPWAVIKPVALAVGMIGLSAVAPSAMRLVGWGMTAMLALIPTLRFARARTDAEIAMEASHASKQLVSAGAQFALWWGAGKAFRWGMERFRAATPGQAGYSSARGDKQVGPARRGGEGTEVEPDNIDFSAIRNDRAGGQKMLAEVRKAVKDETFAATRAAGGKTGPGRPQFEGHLRTPAGRDSRLAMVAEVRKRVHTRVLESHGVAVPANAKGDDLACVRKYLQDIDDAYDIADAVKGVNAAFAAGTRDGSKLATAAEGFLWRERGVPAGEFASLAKGLNPAALKRLRRFTDGYATAQSGRYLRSAAAAGLHDGTALEAMLTRQLALDTGFRLPATGGPNQQSLLSLMRDLDSEGPRTTRMVIEAVNRAMAQGETHYHRLAALGNRAVLAELGVSEATLKGLEPSDAAWRTAFPTVAPAEARATQIRLLRDMLHVLPPTERSGAIAALQNAKAALTDFHSPLAPYLRGLIETGLGGNRRLANRLRTDMTPMQEANFASSLAGLPAGARTELLGGLKGDGARQVATVTERLVQAIEHRWDVKVHRTAGVYPDKGWGYEPFTEDWSVQGLIDLHNGLARLSPNGTLPATANGTAFVRLAGEAVTPSLTPGVLAPPAHKVYARPGAKVYPSGTYGEALTNSRGKDIVNLYDTALKVGSADEIAGIPSGEGTIVHEVGHAIQLGGPAGKRADVRMAAEKKLVAEWSTLSGWKETDGAVADAWYGDMRYYKDPAVRVRARAEVATTYAATDPIEDFAEYTRFFYNDAHTAMRLSPEKFTYYNELVGTPYAPERLAAIAQETGLGAKDLLAVIASMRTKIANATARAVNRPGHWATAH